MRRLPLLLAALATLAGLSAATYYASLGLTLSHYDAKAHLVVSRRILDSLTPGWEQIGAVWLPLPHLINMLPAQVDALYRTGAFATALSIASHAIAVGALAGIVLTLTSSRAGAVLSAVLYTANPNVLYLQSTPMTEPMLFGLVLLQVFLVSRWVRQGRLSAPTSAGWVTVLACLTRYEAWPVTAACLILSAFAWWRRGTPWRQLVPIYTRFAAYPLLAVTLFMAFSRITVGEWFVSGGFFVPDESLRGQPVTILKQMVEGTELLGGAWLTGAAIVAFTAIAAVGTWSAGRTPLLIALSPVAAVALPLAAYYAGHPFRLRYELPLVVGGILASGVAVGLLRRAAVIVAPLLIALVLYEVRPIDLQAPMVREAQLDQQVAARADVTACLLRSYRGGVVMMSMGALGHYMHELSSAGFAIRDFLHEGNGLLWDSAFTRGPLALAEWVIVEEASEGGDAIIQRHRLTAHLLDGYQRTCSAGSITLYQRTPNVAR